MIIEIFCAVSPLLAALVKARSKESHTKIIIINNYYANRLPHRELHDQKMVPKFAKNKKPA